MRIEKATNMFQAPRSPPGWYGQPWGSGLAVPPPDGMVPRGARGEDRQAEFWGYGATLGAEKLWNQIFSLISLWIHVPPSPPFAPSHKRGQHDRLDSKKHLFCYWKINDFMSRQVPTSPRYMWFPQYAKTKPNKIIVFLYIFATLQNEGRVIQVL